MKKVAILSRSATAGAMITGYLTAIFGDMLQLSAYRTGEIRAADQAALDAADLLLLASVEMARDAHDVSFVKGRPHVVCRRTLDYQQLEGLFEIAPGSDVYFVNLSQSTALEAIAQLQMFGFTDFNYIPYYPGAPLADHPVKIAVTTDEAHLAPPGLETIVNLGGRIVDISTTCEIILRLGLPWDYANQAMSAYIRHLARITQRSKQQLYEINHMQMLLKSTFDSAAGGMAVIDAAGQVQMSNHKFIELLFGADTHVIQHNLLQLLEEHAAHSLDLAQLLAQPQLIVNRHGQTVVVTATTIDMPRERLYLLAANRAEEISEQDNLIRSQGRERRQQIRYDFDDYLTQDPQTLRLLERARRLADNHSCVLIQGESGTGKEILAQALHHHSPRRAYPFIPVNFVSLQPALLESELFGYEGGSFTGAKREGKKGLLESAHKGTVFFDEIGDAPLACQTALLRVLQEGEIRRVGGTEMIAVDVRVIAATNKDLRQMIADGLFREDLYYRLNVLPLDTIPLRKRRGDLALLLDYYLQNKFQDQRMTLDYLCTPAIKKYLLNYSWPGNVREIINICEYFYCIKGAAQLDLRDLPAYLLEDQPFTEAELTYTEHEILQLIQSYPKIGRNRLRALLQQRNIEIGEAGLRGALHKLRQNGYININRTKGGSEITELGRAYLSSSEQG